MKITIRELRKIIREVVSQQAGKGVMPGWGGKLSAVDQERLAYGGFRGIDEEENLEEIEGSVEKTNQ